MKKANLVSILTLSLIGTAVFAYAAEPQPGFANLTDKSTTEKVEMPATNDMNAAGLPPRAQYMRNGLPCDRGCQRDFRMGHPMRGSYHRGMMPNNYCMQEGFAYSDWSGFYESNEPTKVADAEKWQDDQLIMLEGNIVKQTGRKYFVFKDASGELTLEIPRRAWRDVVTPKDKVRITAGVEKSWGKTEVLALSVESADETKPAKSQ
ncbi:NirD/YgiW/YdeI family stress tolerance protein [Bisgaard Taxon 10/6]|uniref:YgiW/YdeI family stress tolerance OB fold protein n=1 Tax=Exercitatus varius TaxID=67857 RepID=UPI00294AC9DA|nr:NirD/YgiW/YdeI family stress tolerance protein [Exercitatus varius]MDG2914963.1 NirD/YgiW/YdeI family stress tolerance protein [Exercitatus varius]